MAALSVTNSFVAGTSIVASQMNANFTDVVNWATGAPTLSTSGSTTTISGALAVTEVASFSNQIYMGGATQELCYEGSSADAHETFIRATNATADRVITFPDATGTVALTADITSTQWNDANNILTNSVFN